MFVHKKSTLLITEQKMGQVQRIFRIFAISNRGLTHSFYCKNSETIRNPTSLEEIYPVQQEANTIPVCICNSINPFTEVVTKRRKLEL